MPDRIKAVVSRSRDVNMFAELSQGHRVLVENTVELRDGYTYEAMSCLIVAVFKFEAFLNNIGSHLFSFWDELERLPHKNKLAVIAKHLQVGTDFGSRPYQTIIELFKARDQLAHGKPQSLNHDNIVEHGTREELRRKKPLTKWESLCTIEFAQRAYEDTEQIAETLWESAGFDLVYLRSKGHSYSISEEPQ